MAEKEIQSHKRQIKNRKIYQEFYSPNIMLFQDEWYLNLEPQSSKESANIKDWLSSLKTVLDSMSKTAPPFRSDVSVDMRWGQVMPLSLSE